MDACFRMLGLVGVILAVDFCENFDFEQWMVVLEH